MNKIYYRWNVRCRTGHSAGGMTNTLREAQEVIKDTIELYRDQGYEPVSYGIYGADDVCLVSMDKY